ncbi:transport protein [Klebsiella michiganensis]|uniref:Transport protein n=1 Tax=Klebsiella michiganensis TaxID=1134687 RepID=A0A7H4MYJ5_9ENTR|nr:transport protein [Klebsiella michiganensis]
MPKKVVAVVLPVNAAVVVALQYAVGRRLTARNIRPLMTFGTVCFVLGWAVLLFPITACCCGASPPPIFTLGEVIYAPGEYMLIDNIAPPGMKASYFSAQSLGWLGAAFNPMLTGTILTHLPHWSLFVILMLAIIAAWLMIFRGMNVRPWNGSAVARA